MLTGSGLEAAGRRVADGVWLVPDADRRVDVAGVRAWLRERRVAAAVPQPGFAAAAPVGTPVPIQVMLHIDMAGSPVGVVASDGSGLVPGPDLSRWLWELANAFGVSVTIGDRTVWPGPRPDVVLPAAEDGGAVVLQVTAVHDLPDVVLSRTSAGGRRAFAAQWNQAGWSQTGHRSIELEGWQLFRLDEALADEVTGTRRDLPVVRLLGDSSGFREVQVVADLRAPTAARLVRWPELEVSFAADLTEAELAPLLDPHFSGASGVRRVCASPHFAHVDAGALGQVLQSPLDERWSERVLDALGLPTLAADVHEGREAPEAWGSISRVVAATSDDVPVVPAPRGSFGVGAAILVMVLLAALVAGIVMLAGLVA